MFKKFIFIIFILCFSRFLFSQNLVPNAGFEEKISKKFDGQTGYWKKCIDSDTPDYFNDSLAKNIFKKYIGNVKPHSGKSFTGIFVYRNRPNRRNEIREFIQSPLIQNLKKDSIYYAEAYVIPDQESNAICDGFGIFFSDTLISTNKTERMYLFHPQISNRVNNFINSKTEWTKISGIFRATGNEKYITIGNFKSDTLTNHKKTDTEYDKNKKRKWYVRKNESIAYYYIDDIKVICSDTLNKLKEEPLIIIPHKNCEYISNYTSPPKIILRRTTLNNIDSIIKNYYSLNSLKNDSSYGFPNHSIKKGQSIIFKNILFDFDKSSFKEEAIIELNDLLRLMRQNENLEIEIRGYTDNIGTLQHNIELSIARAKAVEGFLVLNGINKQRIQCYGYGSTQPIDDNKTEDGRKQNRRVEIYILKE